MWALQSEQSAHWETQNLEQTQSCAINMVDIFQKLLCDWWFGPLVLLGGSKNFGGISLERIVLKASVIPPFSLPLPPLHSICNPGLLISAPTISYIMKLCMQPRNDTDSELWRWLSTSKTSKHFLHIKLSSSNILCMGTKLSNML